MEKIKTDLKRWRGSPVESFEFINQSISSAFGRFLKPGIKGKARRRIAMSRRLF